MGAGTVTISGGTVDVQAGGGGYQRNTRYTILDAEGGITGSFTEARTNLAFLAPTLIYEGNTVQLNLLSSEALTTTAWRARPTSGRWPTTSAASPTPRATRWRPR